MVRARAAWESDSAAVPEWCSERMALDGHTGPRHLEGSGGAGEDEHVQLHGVAAAERAVGWVCELLQASCRASERHDSDEGDPD